MAELNEWIVIKCSVKKLVESGTNRDGNHVSENLWNEIRIQRFLNNKEAASGQQQYIGKMVDLCQDDAYVYQILELYRGGELFDVTQSWKHASIPPSPQNKVSPTEQVSKKLMLQMMRSIWFMQKNGVCHKDMSLENTMVTQSGECRIIDFGLGEKWDVTDPSAFQAHYPPCGKLQYMSPECYSIQKDQYYDARANDVWGLGVMYFMMLVGVPPFKLPHKSDGRFVYTMNGKLDHLLKLWNRTHLVSAEAMDFFKRVFRPEQDRITIEEMFSHPAFAQPNHI